jgi:hypothetical protein
MNILQELFEAALKSELSLPRAGLRLITQRFRSAGIHLTKSQRVAIASRLQAVTENDMSLTVALSNAQLAKSGLTPEQRASRTLSLDFDADTFISRIEQKIPSLLLATVKTVSGSILPRLKRDTSRVLKAKRVERGGFEKRLAKRWGVPLDLLEIFRELAVQAGDDFNNEFRAAAAVDQNFTFEVLTRLHARACQVSSEILSLLRSGHADGAHARWRSLHEIAVVGFFVGSRGNAVAERYLLHRTIDSYRAATQYQKYYVALGANPLSDKDMEHIRLAFEGLKDRFGPEYSTDYGWAAAALGKHQPTFRDIEAAAGLEHLRPYYKMASHNVHANPRGAFIRLGLLPNQQMLLAGPSNIGLLNPGHSTAISLGQISTALLLTRPNIDRLVTCQVLLQLENEIGKAFLIAHRRLRRDSRRRSRVRR